MISNLEAMGVDVLKRSRATGLILAMMINLATCQRATCEVPSDLQRKDDYKPKVIVSLTSYPKRFCILPYALKSLCKQTVKPDMILLNLCEEENPDKTLIQKVFSENNLEDKITINWYEESIGPYGKLIPTLKKYPDDIIITVDDDIEYGKKVLAELLRAHKKYPNCIISRVCRFFADDCRFNEWREDKVVPKNRPVFNAVVEGVTGVLYPPYCFDERVFDQQRFMKDFPTTDDIWFSVCAILKGTKKVKLHNFSATWPTRVACQDKYKVSVPELCVKNFEGGKNHENLKKAKAIFKKENIKL
ncbi:hypothetical protein FACS1894198_0880 [Clostridia bacterium]|nr:hypothetical protein FACS1894198_0880 [Clostridia bacterium]